MQKIAHVKPSGAATVLVDDIPIMPDMPVVLKGHYSYRFLTMSETDLDVGRMMKRRYMRAIRIFRRRIDAIMVEVYPKVPYYRDRDISGLLSIIRDSKDNPDLHEMLYDFIKNRDNVRKENKERRDRGDN